MPDLDITELLERVEQRNSLPSPRVCRLIRLKSGVTQHEVASVLQVSASTIARWETGTRRPKGDLLERYLHVLAVLGGRK